MRVIGTAGHVDHGKSTLVAALTGVHPDRLKEEREREMTIDLGFAWLTLSDGEEVGIVDVPGHRDFIENMLAGVGGIDAAMFVVAADEGVMPQTREHLAILDLLQVGGGIIVITKCDLASDPEWLELVEADIRQLAAGSVLADAPVVRVSARTGLGLNELKLALAACLAGKPARPDLGRPRLPVDRIFTMPGFGTIVTGTLADGVFHQGEEVVILPGDLTGRIRGLQTHRQKETQALPGSRTAINLSGVRVEDINRGHVVAHPGSYQPTARLDVNFRLLPDVNSPLLHNHAVTLFIGATEAQARVRLLGSEALKPGETGWLQLELQQPVVAVRGDRYILRRPSPSETLGGGMVVDPHPKGRHRRFSEELLRHLALLTEGTPAEILERAALALELAALREITLRSRLDEARAQEALVSLLDHGSLVLLEQGEVNPQSDLLVMPKSIWARESSRVIKEVEAYQRDFPLRPGMPREQLKNRMKFPARSFNALLQRCQSAGLITETGALVRLPDWEVRFTAQQTAQVNALLQRFAQSPYAPPTIKDCLDSLGEELYTAVVLAGTLKPVSPEVVFRRDDYAEMLRAVRQRLNEQGTLTAAQFRDQFNTSRRYALAFLEHLDAAGVTIREGDNRRLRK